MLKQSDKIKTISSTNQGYSIEHEPSHPNREDRIKALYVGWTDSRKSPSVPVWIPIYRMSWDSQGKFYYSYTHGFKDNLDRLKSKIVNPDCGFNQTWVTPHIDPIISTRIPRRPDSMKQYDLLGLEAQKGDFIAYLARSGGRSATDNFDIFPEVNVSRDGYYHFYFPLLGLATKIRGGDRKIKEIADTISSSENLSLKLTPENGYIFGRNKEIGHIPPYLHHLLECHQYQENSVEIVKINQKERSYGGKIILGVKIKFSDNPFDNREFRPLNPMSF